MKTQHKIVYISLIFMGLALWWANSAMTPEWLPIIAGLLVSASGVVPLVYYAHTGSDITGTHAIRWVTFPGALMAFVVMWVSEKTSFIEALLVTAVGAWIAGYFLLRERKP